MIFVGATVGSWKLLELVSRKMKKKGIPGTAKLPQVDIQGTPPRNRTYLDGHGT